MVLHLRLPDTLNVLYQQQQRRHPPNVFRLENPSPEGAQAAPAPLPGWFRITLRYRHRQQAQDLQEPP
ncbi:hypothetical protein ARTHRO8AJ_450027 [Arthrobacter sp. 8AJ]|nr:hypothetical protein ARTHRO8AJ_450027 [Arthrobacter sp. 8AJ]